MIALVDADVVAYRVAFGCNDDPEKVAIAKVSVTNRIKSELLSDFFYATDEFG